MNEMDITFNQIIFSIENFIYILFSETGKSKFCPIGRWMADCKDRDG